LNTSIARRTEQDEPQDPIINIRKYTKVASIRLTEDSKANEGQPADLLLAPEAPRTHSEGQFHLTLSNMVTADITEEKYDVVMYATGYERSAWLNFLKHTGIGKHFGLSPATRKVNLLPTTDLTDEVPGYSTPDSPISESRSPVSSSTNTSPPTSPEASMFNSVQFDAELNNELYVTRSYQLLPKSTPRDGGKSLVPRIYLQGVEEATHGLSDTLLSVLGVRSGEVLADLSKRPVA
jgi:L-ornithine N5-oxygenase